MSERVPPVRSELLAAKIEKLRNFESPELFDEFSAEPRLFSLLWFLEYVSKPGNYAGGLTKFAGDCISASADLIGTPTMIRLGKVSSYRAEDAVAIMKELRQSDRDEILGAEAWLFENAFAQKTSLRGHVTAERVVSDYALLLDREEEKETWSGAREILVTALVEMLTPSVAHQYCTAYVTSNLALYFKDACERSDVGFGPEDAPKYFSQVGPALLAFMDRRAESLKQTLGETEVTRLIFRWMKKARAMNEPVMLSGNSRFGKTEAVKLLCRMQPGEFRFVKTPSTSAIGDLLREVARSLGIEVGATNNGRELRERIDYVLRFSKVVLCFDEFQWTLPSSYSRSTAPARLNWIRSAVLDEELSAVFVCTPQSYLPAKKRFVKTTGFAMEQFDERVLKTVHLPNELCEADLFAAARIHFSDSSDDYLRIVIETVLAAERNFISDISKIATLAKDNAREHGRALPLLCDIEEAIADVLPAPVIPTLAGAKRSGPAIATPLPSPRKATPKPTSRREVASNTFPNRREIRPLSVIT
ncbi:MAG TPA: AAA family ATPase [Chthoniobacterales bacterium]|jgi:hypothetical protein